MATVETALGPLATAQLGPTLMHEHLFFDLRAKHVRAPWDRDGSFANAKATPDTHARSRWDWFAYCADPALPTV